MWRKGTCLQGACATSISGGQPDVVETSVTCGVSLLQVRVEDTATSDKREDCSFSSHQSQLTLWRDLEQQCEVQDSCAFCRLGLSRLRVRGITLGSQCISYGGAAFAGHSGSAHP